MMGSTCSMQRERNGGSFRGRRGNLFVNHGSGGRERTSNGPQVRRLLRHSVVSALPDGCIETLYPLDDNYVNDEDGRGTRSPKSLAELATDALCRSLPRLNGELPPGLPQDVVDDIVHSLIKHSALNATTLRVMRNCELGALSLAGCRGVTDEWLQPLSTRSIYASCPDFGHQHHHSELESMDFEVDHQRSSSVPEAAFYGTFGPHNKQSEDSSCSTSSFVSATSNPYADASEDHPMGEASDPSLSPDMLQDHHHHHHKMLPMPGLWETTSVTANLTLLDLRGSQRLTDRGLLQLTDLGRLEVVRLDNCHALVGRGLLAFSASHRLHTLSLANCRRLTDEAIINISHLLSLEALSVDGCRCLTDRSLAALADLYGLRKLDLSQCDLITDLGLDQLENLEGLEELSLGWCRQITDRGLDRLSRHPGRHVNMRVLRLARCSIRDEGIAHLARLEALEELDINGCSRIGSIALGSTLERLKNLTSLDVSYIPGILRSGFQGKIDKVKSLELCYAGAKDTHLAKLAHLPALEEINLDSCHIGDWAISHFADNNVVPNLKSLDLADTDLTDNGMAKLAQFKNLIRLSLFYCNISNRGLRHIAKLSKLEVLNLDSREISDDGLRHLKNLTCLKSLDIFSGRITDSGCTHIACITSLETLELCGGGVGDLGCTALARLENLKSLNLSQNERITNRGAAALAALINLKALNLSNTRVNSSALRFFGGLVKLQSLALYGCRGIEDSIGLDKLQDDLPNLKCLRLNRASDQDGVVLAVESSSDDDSDMWSDHVAHGSSDGDMDEDDDDDDIYSDND